MLSFDQPNRARCRFLAAFLVGLALAAGLGLAGCDLGPKKPVRIGMVPLWPGYEFLYLARDKGFFAEAGVDVELINLASTPDVRRALSNGQIDGMASTVFETVQGHDGGDPALRIVLAIDYSNGADIVVANGAIADPAGLKGMRLGAQPGSFDMYVWRLVLAEAGLAPVEVVFVPVDEDKKVEALADGEIDAVVGYPALWPDLEAAGGHVIFTSAQIPGTILDVLTFSTDIVETRADDLAKVIGAWNRTLAFAADHPDEAYALMGEREDMTAAEFGNAVAGLRMLSPADQAGMFDAGGGIENDVAAALGMLGRFDEEQAKNEAKRFVAPDIIRAAMADGA